MLTHPAQKLETQFSSINEVAVDNLHERRLKTIYSDKFDVLRFVAISSIVWMHTFFGWNNLTFKAEDNLIPWSLVIQLGKFGTIIFFIITGFYLEDKISSFTLKKYLRYRWRALIFPWFFFLTFFVVIQGYRAYVVGEIFKGNIVSCILDVVLLYRNFIVYNIYWFVPVSVFSGCILVFFKKYVTLNAFGLGLALATLFYNINLYQEWVTVHHTKAILGYVFFMWFGMLIKKHLTFIDSLLNNLSWQILISIFLITTAVACAEGIYLEGTNSEDSFSSIRMSNCFFSISAFFLMLKFEKVKWIKHLSPRRYAFGIYLVHTIIINETMPYLKSILRSGNLDSSLFGCVLIHFVYFLFIMSFSQLVSFAIKNSRLKSLIGG